MIETLDIVKYRKLKNISFSFDNKINIIAGGNGTCKSSILYLISNSFKTVSKATSFINDDKCLKALNLINFNVNPKIENLTKGDKEYNDPAPMVTGKLFSCKYENGWELNFRRHNSVNNEKRRFAIKPEYPKGQNQKLPELPVLYLGLSRLFSYGEYLDDDKITQIKNGLPSTYLENVKRNYKKFTNMEIDFSSFENMGGIKKRASFKTNKSGIDSNTISAGEDNLLILLLALESLRYYFDSIASTRQYESLFLIDEMDATLHPEFQIKLLNLFIEYSEKYKIKFIFTTHSISLIEYALKIKQNVIYLINNVTDVTKMEDVNIYKIKAILNNSLVEDIFSNHYIPILTEDAESRDFLNCIFDIYSSTHPSFAFFRSHIYLPDINMSSAQLQQLFNDPKLNNISMNSICVLDGDMDPNMNNCIICLPGNASPEKLAFDYLEELYNSDDFFWKDRRILDQCFTKTYYIDNIKNVIEENEEKIKQNGNEGKTTKGMRREYSKKLFNTFEKIMIYVFNYWISKHQNDINKFITNLHSLYIKVAQANGLSSTEWVLD